MDVDGFELCRWPAPRVAGLQAGIRLATRPEDFRGRTGYDEGFLAVAVALPTFTGTAASDVLDLTGVVGARTPWLHYEHFSVAMSKSRRLARVTAVNICVSQRPAEGEVLRPRGFYVDGRLRADQQLADAGDLYGRRHGFDRGHLVRREDPVWGDISVARRANRDTHHFPNISPQHELFNQDMNSWRAAEEYIAEQLATDHDRISVFTGPIFGAKDPQYEQVRVPIEYWKLVVTAASAARPVAVAFRFSQAAQLRRSAVGDRVDWLERIAAKQETVVRLERLCGLDFGELRDHDTRATRAVADGIDPTDMKPLPLKQLSDLVL